MFYNETILLSFQVTLSCRERIYDPPDIDGLFEKHVWPEYVKCNEHVKKQGLCTFIDASLDKKKVISSIVNSLEFIEQ